MTFGKNDDPDDVGLLYNGGSWVYLVAFVFIGPIILTNLLVRKRRWKIAKMAMLNSLQKKQGTFQRLSFSEEISEVIFVS